MKKVLLFFGLMLCFMLIGGNLLAQWSALESPEKIVQCYGTNSDTKLFFAGGLTLTEFSSEVRIYDIPTESWSSASLNVARAKIAAVVHNDLLFCAGGITFDNRQEYDEVEIYNATTGAAVTIATLSKSRIELSAVGVGDKVLFAGGIAADESGINEVFSTVDIYDGNTEMWTQAELSEARGGMAHAVLGDKVYFAGGYKGNGQVSNTVDIYDASTGTWTTDVISVGRAFYGGGIAFDGKIYFAGGLLANETTTALIDVYDPSTDTWTTQQLSEARFGVQAGKTDNYLLFSGGGSTGLLTGWAYTSFSTRVDLYNKETDDWDIFNMALDRVNHAALSVGNQVFIAGDIDGNTSFSVIDIFTEEEISNTLQAFPSDAVEISPNPTNSLLDLRTLGIQEANLQLEILNVHGRVLLSQPLTDKFLQLDVADFSKGLYHLKIRSAKKIAVRQFVKL
ncbi:MAG: kelch repeat-containing protein [Bacteroidota bacterium]